MSDIVWILVLMVGTIIGVPIGYALYGEWQRWMERRTR